MITKETAMKLELGQTLYHDVMRGSDKRPVRCRVNGKCKIWKTRPDKFQLPVKYGFKDCFYITERNAANWFVKEEEAMA